MLERCNSRSADTFLCHVTSLQTIQGSSKRTPLGASRAMHFSIRLHKDRCICHVLRTLLAQLSENSTPTAETHYTQTSTRSCDSFAVKAGFLHHAALHCAKDSMSTRALIKAKHCKEDLCQHCVTDSVVCGMQRRIWRTRLTELAMKPRQPLGMGACSSRSMWSRPGTSKCRSWLTTMAMWCIFMRGIAQCSGAIRR